MTALQYAPLRSRRTEYMTKPAHTLRNSVPPTTYGVVSKLPVSASSEDWAAESEPSATGSAVEVSAPARVIVVVDVHASSSAVNLSAVALADGTNHRAPSRAPAAVAVSNDRRAADTEYRSPCGTGECAVWADVNEGAGLRKVTVAVSRTLRRMSNAETSRFLCLRVELVLEVEDEDGVTRAALRRIAGDMEMPDDERAHTESAVTEDTAEALLVSEVPGVELAQASWSSERIDYDSDSPEWALGEDDDAVDEQEEVG